MEQHTLITLALAAAVARLSAILAITFAVKVLLNLYSYHIRLAEFHAARISALTTIGIASLDDLEQLVRILSPESIAFDKAPEAPDLNEIIKMLAKGKE